MSDFSGARAKILVNFWEPFPLSKGDDDFGTSRSFAALARQFPGLEFTQVSSIPLVLAANAKFLVQRALEAILSRHLTGRWREIWIRFALVSLLTERYVKRTEADLVLSHGSIPYPLSGTSVPQIVYLNLEAEHFYMRGGTLEHLPHEIKAKRWALRNAWGVVTSHEESARRLRTAIPELRDRVYTIPWYLPTLEAVTEEAVRTKQLTDERVSILFVGGEARRKGLANVFAGWKLTDPSIRRRAELTVVSRFTDGEVPAPPGVRVIRGLPRQEVFAAMSRSHVFVFPTLRETFGKVLIEAMAKGCCVLSSAQPPQDWILDYGAAGVLVNPESPVEICRALEDVVRNRAHRVEIALKARRRFLEVFHHLHVGRQLYGVFKSAIASTRREPSLHSETKT